MDVEIMTEINITDNKTIEEIQKEFQDHFPYLKIEFYSSEHEAGEGSDQDEMIDSGKTIGQARVKDNAGEVSIRKSKG